MQNRVIRYHRYSTMCHHGAWEADREWVTLLESIEVDDEVETEAAEEPEEVEPRHRLPPIQPAD